MLLLGPDCLLLPNGKLLLQDPNCANPTPSHALQHLGYAVQITPVAA
jgi:hypothetical protein